MKTLKEYENELMLLRNRYDTVVKGRDAAKVAYDSLQCLFEGLSVSFHLTERRVKKWRKEGKTTFESELEFWGG